MAKARGVYVKVITGQDELLRKLKELGDLAVGSMLVDAVTPAAQPVINEAQDRVRVKSGNLRDHIQAGEVKRAGFRAEIPVGMDKKVGFYGPFLETGHAVVRGRKVVGHVPAYPFLRPAVPAARKAVRSIISKVVRERIETVARS